ncbi:unnamed protein product [Durusdinium trenchii]|uniref:Uncharacterized protein n=1 Tax=Durusdinium trenchii TaxID=1381693 RepID=A0ABP0KK38_9DINO
MPCDLHLPLGCLRNHDATFKQNQRLQDQTRCNIGRAPADRTAMHEPEPLCQPHGFTSRLNHTRWRSVDTSWPVRCQCQITHTADVALRSWNASVRETASVRPSFQLRFVRDPVTEFAV